MRNNQVTSGEEVQRQNGSEGVAQEEAINITKLAAFIRENRENQPKQLKTTAGGRKCCIFRIPQSLKEFNPQAYKPHIIFIGPYHHGKEELSMMEEHKWRFLNVFLARSVEGNGLVLEDYLKAMAKLEVSARECYSEEINKMNSEQFVKMLVLDGCFLVELLRAYHQEVDMMKEDPIFYIPWVIPFLMRDLLRLENQLPFFVVQCLFDLSNAPNGKHKFTLPVLAIKFFSETMKRPDEVLQWSIGENYNHLLDLFRATFIPPHLKEPVHNESAKVFHCVSKLLRSGIRFKSMDQTKSFLEISFKKGKLQIPHLKIDDIVSSFFQNCVAYEQAHRHCGTYFTTYATFMDCLIDTDKDVALLGDEKIIENYFGNDDDVAKFFNELGRDMNIDVEDCYLAEQFDAVNKYYGNSLHVRWAEFKNTYFSTPWSFISALAALILLVLTLTQTTFTTYPYYHPRS